MTTGTFKDLRNAINGKAPMPSVIQDTLYIHMTDFGSIYISESEHALDGWTLLFSHPVELAIPRMGREDIVEAQVAGLEKVKRNILAEAQAKVDNIDLTIQNLRALEYRPGDEQ